MKANPSLCITPNNDIDNSKTPFQNFIAINTTGLNRISSAQKSILNLIALLLSSKRVLISTTNESLRIYMQ